MAVIKLRDQGKRGVETIVLANLAGNHSVPRAHSVGSVPSHSFPMSRDDVQLRAEEIIRAAEEQATQTLEEAVRFAEEEGQSIMEAAQAEGFEKGREAGYQAGLVEGREAGFQEGLSQGKAQAEEEYRALLGSLSELTAVAREPRSVLEDCSVEGLLEFALAIAQRVVATEVTTNPRCLLANVSEALVRCGGSVKAALRVNPQDAETIRGRVEAIRREAGLDHLTIVEDASIERGGCMAETPAGIVDARTDTRIREIARELMEECGACMEQDRLQQVSLMDDPGEEADAIGQH